MKAVIMAGGLGTRLRPLTFSIPKPLLPVGEKPILEIILNKLRENDIRDIILATGYRAELIKTYFEDGEKFGVRIRYADEHKPLGTAGTLHLVKNSVNPGEPFLMMNGDILTKLDFRNIIRFHTENQADLTVGTKKYTHQLPYGVMQVDAKKVIDIKEKPQFDYHINAGIYVMSPAVLDLIPADTYYDMPTFIRALIDEGKKVLSYFITDYWLAIEQLGHFEEALNATDEWR